MPKMTSAAVQRAHYFKPGVPDWSSVHESTGVLEPVIAKEEWRRFEWPPERLEQFHKDGFVSNIPVLSHEQCDRILDDFGYFMGTKKHPGMPMMYKHKSNGASDPDKVLMHALGHWRLTQPFHDLVFLPQHVVPVWQCLGGSAVRFWHDQLFAKPAYHGALVGWHQDYSLWTKTEPMCHMTVHIALEDQNEENGTLKYIPGSHRWTRNNGGPLPMRNDFNFDDMDEEKLKLILTPEELAAFKPVSSMLKKGEASFHHGLSVHGSHTNRSPKSRMVAVLNYFADGAYSNSDEELIKGTNLFVPKGKKLDGQFFPLVFDPVWLQ